MTKGVLHPQAKAQKKHNGLFVLACARGYLGDVRPHPDRQHCHVFCSWQCAACLLSGPSSLPPCPVTLVRAPRTETRSSGRPAASGACRTCATRTTSDQGTDLKHDMISLCAGGEAGRAGRGRGRARQAGRERAALRVRAGPAGGRALPVVARHRPGRGGPRCALTRAGGPCAGTLRQRAAPTGSGGPSFATL
jgi:hypothetical protein